MKNHHHNNPIHPKPVATIAPTHEDITARAETLWINHGRPENQDKAIWLEAEGQLLADPLHSSENPKLPTDF